MRLGRDDIAGALPPMLGHTEVLADTQELEDIVRGVLFKHKQTRGDYDKLVDRFYITGESAETLCRKLFDFCLSELPYKVEGEDYQTLRTPAAILALGPAWGVDCKHYAAFIAGVLDAVNRKYHTGFKWKYRFASYDPLVEEPGHVFVVVDLGKGKDIWVDPVLPYFDVREPNPFFFTDKTVGDMSLVSISGIGNREQFEPARSWVQYGFDWVPPGTVGAAGRSDAQKIGTGLLAAAPALATVPVAGWIAGAAATVVGGLLQLFGKNPETKNNRQLYYQYSIGVLGKDQITRLPGGSMFDKLFEKAGSAGFYTDNVTPQQMDECQAWFSIVLGVPIENYSDIANLLVSGKAYWDVKKQFVPDISLAADKDIEAAILQRAHNILKTMNYGFQEAGAWRDMVAARIQTELPVNPETLQGGGIDNPVATGNNLTDLLTTGNGTTKAGINPLLWLGIAGAAAYMFFGSKRKVGATKNVLPWIIGGTGALIAVVLLTRSKQTTPVPVYQPPVYQPGQSTSAGGGGIWEAAPGIIDSLSGALDKIFNR